MSALGHVWRRARREESGQILVFWALFAGVTLFLVASLVVDVGNWYTHKRQLQLRVDAGALAGSAYFASCFADSGTGNTSISNTARNYAGSPTAPGTPYNNVFPNQANVHVLINSSAYWNHGGADNSDTAGAPCAAGYVDVKGTDANVPWFFRFAEAAFGASPTTINAEARVKIFQTEQRSGNLPVAVPDPGRVTAMQVDFIDEATGTVKGTTPLLTKGAPSGGILPWTGTASAVSVNGVERLGVRVKLTGQDPAPTSITCGQVLVECYDAGTGPADNSNPTNGVLLLHGYPTAGKGDGTGAPLIRAVRMLNETCPSASPYFVASAPGKKATCRLGVQAEVLGSPTSVSATLTPHADSGEVAATEGLKQVGATTTWQTDGTGQAKWFDVANDSGPYNVTLRWEKRSGSVNGTPCGNGNGSNPPPCTDTWGGLIFQRAFSATGPRSGPIQLIRVSEAGVSPMADYATFDNSASTKSLDVLVHIPVGISNATGPTAPPIALKVSNESLGQSIDCDPAIPNLRAEIIAGCEPRYKINTSGACPAANVLWGLPQPWECAKTDQGGAAGQVEQGITERVLQGGTCADHPNNFSLFPSIPEGDTRIVEVILTSFGAFSGSGQTTVPVTDFAHFYITGWAKSSGGKASGPHCAGDDNPPAKGWIIGRFIKYVDPSGSGSGSVACDLNAVGSCVAVMIK